MTIQLLRKYYKFRIFCLHAFTSLSHAFVHHRFWLIQKYDLEHNIRGSWILTMFSHLVCMWFLHQAYVAQVIVSSRRPYSAQHH